MKLLLIALLLIPALATADRITCEPPTVRQNGTPLEPEEIESYSFDLYNMAGERVGGATQQFCDWTLTAPGRYTVDVSAIDLYSQVGTPASLEFTVLPKPPGAVVNLTHLPSE